MADPIILTPAEFASLEGAIGSRNQARMIPEIETRLRALRLIERREWPNGPMWRTTRGDRLVRQGR